MMTRLFSKKEILELLGEGEKSLFSHKGNPFATDEWLRHWVSQIASDEWEFHIARDADGRARMLLYRDPRQPSTFSSAANYYTILSPAEPTQLPGPVLELRPLEASSQEVLGLERTLRSAGWYVRKTTAHGNWYLPCSGTSFEQYLASRPSQLRNTLRRKAKRFPGTVELCTESSGFERALSAYEMVYLRSWKRPEPYPDFISGWMRICARRGWLRLAVAWLDDVPIAAQFWFVFDGRAHVYKLAYDEAHKEHSAGTILTARLMQHVLDVDHVSEVDYGCGDDAYKRDWMTLRRERVVLTACDMRTVRGMLRAVREQVGEMTAPIRSRARTAAVVPGNH